VAQSYSELADYITVSEEISFITAQGLASNSTASSSLLYQIIPATLCIDYNARRWQSTLVR